MPQITSFIQSSSHLMTVIKVSIPVVWFLEAEGPLVVVNLAVKDCLCTSGILENIVYITINVFAVHAASVE